MKKPNKPSEPSKPIIPPVKRLIPHTISINESSSLTALIDLIPKELSIPLSALNILVEDEYDPYSGDGGARCYLEYFTEENDPDYGRSMKTYENKLKEYDKKMETYKTKMSEFVKEQKAYDKWSEEKSKEERAKEIAALEKKLAKLKK